MDHEEMKRDLVQLVMATAQRDFPDLKSREAAKLALEKVDAFERSAMAAWTPATGGMPGTPKLAPGDNLLVVNFKTRYRPEFVQGAEVQTMARFKVELSWVSLETGRPDSAFFDVRTGGPWTTGRDAGRMYRGGGIRFFTRDQWAWKLRARLADEYLKDRGVYPSSVCGPLSVLFHEDRLGFANALRRLEGLVEL